MYFGYDYEQKVSEFHPRIVSLEQRNNETKEDVLKFLRGNIVGQGKGESPLDRDWARRHTTISGFYLPPNRPNPPKHSNKYPDESGTA